MSDYNPVNRLNKDFLLQDGVPSKISIIAGKMQGILSTQVYTEGVDLSHWNWTTEPDFDVIKANGFEYVIFKATESNWFVDDKFQVGYEKAHDAGLLTMAYHFNRTNKSGFDQAQWMLKNIATYLNIVDGKTILFNDVESNDGGTLSQRQNRAKAFNETIVEEGFQTGNYSSKSLWESIIGFVTWANKYKQWVAHWTPNSKPLKPNGWDRDDFWQYGISPAYSWAKYVGTDGNVDVNRFYGTLQELKDLLGISPVPPVDCCDELNQKLDDVVLEIQRMNQEISSNGQAINGLTSDLAQLSDKVLLMENELRVTKNKVTYLESEQNAMQNQLDILFDLLDQIKGILCV